VLAVFIDAIWLVLLNLGLGWLIYGEEYFETTKFYIDYLDVVISDVVPFVITMVFWMYYAATPGKMLLGLKIVDADTFAKVPAGRLVLRYIGYFLSLIILCIGYLCIAWDERKQGLHDKIAKTVVIKTR
jgi:uncharacterized RDD family membrane protein YckC